MTEGAAAPVVFIANRGEIAVRVIRAARDLGYRSAVMYVDADAGAPYVALADDARRVEDTGGNPFLDPATVVAQAVAAGAALLHPGYGFLSENPAMARAVDAAGLTWVGPSAEAIEALGDKVSARRIAAEAGAPLTRGLAHPTTDPQEIASFAQSVGFPIVVKAAHGGGGRGMRIIRAEAEIEQSLHSARAEAAVAFGRDDCFVEQYLERPRHIETQCLADAHGAVSVIGTRDCSLQRRHQKLFEEAPAPGLTPEQVEVITAASKAILRRAGYVGAATCEFLLSAEGALAFLEVNTRIQVEHTVTEAVSGIDLIVQQFRIARGESVVFPDHQAQGVAFEFRINSEDPLSGFFPSTGTLTAYDEPSGPWVRVDSGVRAGTVVSGAFDSMLAKLIVTGADRAEASARARRALAEYRIEGVRTVLPFFEELLETDAFRNHGGAAGIYTDWLEQEFLPEVLDGVRARVRSGDEGSSAAPPAEADPALVDVRIRVDGREVTLAVPSTLLAHGVPGVTDPPRVSGLNIRGSAPELPEGHAVTAPARAVVIAVHVREGDTVQEGEALATLEVMKMEHRIVAPVSGRVAGLVAVGALVSPDAPVARIL